jgi:hypothetical protein
MSKKLIGYLLVAVVAFAIGTQTKIPTKKIAATFRPADVAEDKSWGGRSDKPLLDNETGAAQYAETSKVGKYPGEKRFQSAYIGGELIIPSGVFMPGEAEAKVLPLMSAHADIFKGKTVLEIGAGSGPISI